MSASTAAIVVVATVLVLLGATIVRDEIRRRRVLREHWEDLQRRIH